MMIEVATTEVKQARPLRTRVWSFHSFEWIFPPTGQDEERFWPGGFGLKITTGIKMVQ